MADTLLQKTLRQISESLPENGEQALPTEQPVVAEPAIDYIDPSKINLSNFSVLADPGPAYDPNMVFKFDIGAGKSGTTDASGKTTWTKYNAPIVLQPGEQYVLTDAKGEKVIGRASTPEEMQNLIKASDAQPYGWNIYKADSEGNYTPGAQLFGKPDPRVGGLMGALVNYGLPIGVGLLTGGIGALPSLGAGTTAGLMGATGLVSGLASGKSFGNALLQGALAAGTAGLLKGTPVGDAINKAVNNVPVVGDALRGISKTLDLGGVPASTGGTDIVVNAARDSAPGLITGGIGGLANLASASPPTTQGPEPRRTDYGDKVEPTPDEAPIVVTGQRLNNIINMIANGAYMNEVINAGYSLDEYDAALNKFNADREIVSRGQLAPELPPVPVPVTTQGPVDNVAPPEDEIVVTRKNEQPVTGIDAIINSVAPSLNAPTMDVPAQAQDKGMSAGDYIRLAGLGASVLGALGGGGGGGSSLSTSGGGALNFTPTNRSFTGGGIGGGAGGSFDPFTYGQALPGAQTAEYLFFQPAANAGYQTTPAMAAPEAMPAYKDGGEVDDDMVRHLVEWHKGGGHTGPGKVKGIGSGQEDLIPAWLSDGEYVWSAQDVADLGDGSTDEGVRRLDKMRQMVRRRAGRKDVKKIAKPQRGIDTMLKAVGGSV